MAIVVGNSTHKNVWIKFFREGYELGAVLLAPFTKEKVEYDFDEMYVVE